jgi:hypothetical protein
MEISEGFKAPYANQFSRQCWKPPAAGCSGCSHPVSWTIQREMLAIGTVAVQLPGHDFDNSLRCHRCIWMVKGDSNTLGSSDRRFVSTISFNRGRQYRINNVVWSGMP